MSNEPAQLILVGIDEGFSQGCEDGREAVASIDYLQCDKDFVGKEDPVAVTFFHGIGEGFYLRLDVFL